MKYALDLVYHIAFEVDAESREEAVRLAEKAHPHHKADFILDEDGSSSTIDTCDNCGKPLFEDSNYSVDLDNWTSFCNDTCVPPKFDSIVDNEEVKPCE